MEPTVPSIAPRVAATPATGLRPVVLALAGDSASRKSTLSRGIEFILGVVRHPGKGQERSESLALAQLLVVSHLVGAFDGAFEL